MSTTRLYNAERTIQEVERRIVSSDPFYFVRFGDCDISMVELEDFPGNKRHTNSPDLGRDLAKTIGIIDRRFMVATIEPDLEDPRMISAKASRSEREDDCDQQVRRLVRLTNWLVRERSRPFWSALCFQFLCEDPPKFVDFCKTCFSGRRTLLVAGESLCRSRLVCNMVNAQTSIEFPDRNAYYVLDEEREEEIISKSSGYDLIISAIGQATRTLARTLWRRGVSTQYLDLGSCLDAVSGRPTRGWIERDLDRLKTAYEEAFGGTK